MLDELLKTAKNDDELIAFLSEYVKFFDENDFNVIKNENVNEHENININQESLEDELNCVSLFEKFSEYVIDVSDKDAAKDTLNLNNIEENKKTYKRVLKLSLRQNSTIKKRRKILVHKIVKDGIENHIDPICIKVYNKLLEKNIYIKNIIINDTKIKIVLDKLSEENEDIFTESCSINPRKYMRVGNNNVVEVQKTGKSDSNLKNELVKAVRFFKMQDVQIGFIDQKKFLMHFCDCERVEGHSDIEYNKNLKITFDENKMEKSFEEYLQDKRFDKLYSSDNNKVYLDEYYFNGHKNYLDYLNRLNNLNNLNVENKV